MSIVKGGQAASDLDRGMELALGSALDDVLMSGLWPGEEEQPRAVLPLRLVPNRPWQKPIQTPRYHPGSEEPFGPILKASLKVLAAQIGAVNVPAIAMRVWSYVTSWLVAIPGRVLRSAVSKLGAFGSAVRSFGQAKRREPVRRPTQLAVTREDEAERTESASGQRAEMTTATVNGPDGAEFRFVPGRLGIVVVHGIGPQLAGQTLLDWTRPIITALTDWRAANVDSIAILPAVADPVVKANIDFSGSTFPVLQVRVPGMKSTADIPPDDPRTRDQRWVFTEAWWAAEVRPPTLSTMIGWLGEQGGVGRIVQGIQENQFGGGLLGKIAQVSLGAFVSVIVSFVLLLFLALLGISKLIPFGPLKNAVALRLAASFLTDWFGGARTLLRDPSQSANVRSRLVTTIKALRAYGCRDVVIVAHSGGTMVSFTTLTDPAFPNLKVQKLITIGEALNLGWRLEDQNPDLPPPTPPKYNRMRADLAALQPQLQWRDFWASHDPAPSGPPQFPRDGVSDPDCDVEEPGPYRFTAERVYNRMSIGEDHGGYWDNDEQFVIPLLRELDVPRGDRTNSRFFSDADESTLRARRKERVSMLALWRRVTLALPVMAILAAATVTAPGMVKEAGSAGLAAFGLIPGNEIFDRAGRWLAERGAEQPFADLPTWVPGGVRNAPLWIDIYDVGLLALRFLFLIAIVQAVAPSRLDRLWARKGLRRLWLLSVDLFVGVGIGLVLFVAWLRGPHGATFDIKGPVTALFDTGVGWAVVSVAAVITFDQLGRWARRRMRGLEGNTRWSDRFTRGMLIVLSSTVLATVLLALMVIVVGVVLVMAGNDAIPASDSTRSFVIGGLVILLLFQAGQRIGVWRWISWDLHERHTLRRDPQAEPYRNWIRLQSILLAVDALIGAILVALGNEDRSGWIGDRGPWLFAFFALLIAIVIMSIGKDVVDSDIDDFDRRAAAVVPPVVGPAP